MKLFFHKMIKFNENCSKSTSYFVSCIKKLKKWDRSLASILGLLAFFTLIGIYTIFRQKTCINCKPDHEVSCDSKDEENSRMTPASRIEQKCFISNDYCDVICAYLEMNESLGEHINSALVGIEPPCSAISLEIELTQFAEAQLSIGWLRNLEPKVNRLIIYKGNLREINKHAFRGHPFKESLKFFRLEFTNVATLRKNSFLGLSLLNTFEFNGINKMKLEIEEEALAGMDNLISLVVKMFILTSKDIINLIGDKGVPQRQLKQLALVNNFFPELLENSFANIKESVKELNLDGNGIETIHKKIFSGMKNLEILTLFNNNFETLEDGTFNSLSNLIPGGLGLGYNKWNCTCSLQWLKDYFNNTNFIDKSNPPLCNDKIEFDDFEFCPTATTSSIDSPPTENTPTSTTSTSVTNPECAEIRKKSGIEILECKSERLYPKYKSASNDEFHTAEIIVEDQKVTLQLQELEGNPLEVKVMLSEPIEILKSYYLVWTSSENKTKYSCKTHLEDGLFLQLERDTTYAFSVLHQCESETSPECTFGMKTLPEWPLKTWISNEYQAVVIGVTVLVAICMIGIAALATFLCIRRYPKLISGNKSVIIVEPTKIEESASSMVYERPQYWEPSITSSTQGCITPKYHRYARINYRPPLMRSISELAVSSNISLYEQPLPNIGKQNQRMERSKRMEVYAYQDYRPPLPPPNPGPSYSSNDVPDELIYSSV